MKMPGSLFKDTEDELIKFMNMLRMRSIEYAEFVDKNQKKKRSRSATKLQTVSNDDENQVYEECNYPSVPPQLKEHTTDTRHHSRKELSPKSSMSRPDTSMPNHAR
jgi:hypothetical protein